MEEWKDIAGYEGLYQVSTLGRVKSLARISAQGHQLLEKYLKPRRCTTGYFQVCLSKNGNLAYKDIHRLVAQAFIPNLENLPQVNHKDESRTNNCVDNLEWCTAKYNANYGTRNERVAEARKGQRLSGVSLEKMRHKLMKKVMCVETGEVFDSIEAAKEFTHTSNVCNALKGRNKTAGGYHWRYA